VRQSTSQTSDRAIAIDVLSQTLSRVIGQKPAPDDSLAEPTPGDPTASFKRETAWRRSGAVAQSHIDPAPIAPALWRARRSEY
jgi:hypothetical protein